MSNPSFDGRLQKDGRILPPTGRFECPLCKGGGNRYRLG